jgi:hypothetical protein
MAESMFAFMVGPHMLPHDFWTPALFPVSSFHIRAAK